MEPTKLKSSVTTVLRKTKSAGKQCRHALVGRSLSVKFSDEDHRTYWAIVSLRECLNRKKDTAMLETRI